MHIQCPPIVTDAITHLKGPVSVIPTRTRLRSEPNTVCGCDRSRAHEAVRTYGWPCGISESDSPLHRSRIPLSP